MLCDAFVCSVFIVSSPSSSPVDPETGVGVTEYDYVTDDPSCATELPGKPPPLITRYSLLFSILLALE